MIDPKTGGPAFPYGYITGMTLRDWFAGQAIAAFLIEDGTINFHTRAKEAYELADAMLAERNKP